MFHSFYWAYCTHNKVLLSVQGKLFNKQPIAPSAANAAVHIYKLSIFLKNQLLPVKTPTFVGRSSRTNNPTHRTQRLNFGRIHRSSRNAWCTACTVGTEVDNILKLVLIVEADMVLASALVVIYDINFF
jgi:hypothetical protein